MLNFCDAKTACKILQCSDRTLLRYRQQNKLIEGIHWGRNPSGKILYNHVLLNQLRIPIFKNYATVARADKM